MKFSHFIFFISILVFSSNKAMGQLSADKKDSVNYCKLGNQFLSDYQFGKALSHLKICCKNDPQNLQCLEKIATCNYQLGQLKDAKNNYQKILALDSENSTALNNLGLIFSKESNYVKAIEQYQKLIAMDSANSYYYRQCAKIYGAMDQVNNAILYYEKALQFNPNDIMVIMDLCSFYQKYDKYAEADSLVNMGMLLDSTNMKLWYFQAKSAFHQKNYLLTVKSINKILQSTKDTSTFMLKLLGISYFHIQNYQQAIPILNNIISKKEGAEIICYYLGLAYNAVGKPNKSLSYFEEAINQGISNNLAIYYTQLGITYEELGMYQESIKNYQAAYKTSKNKKLLYHLARNYDAYYKNKKTALRYYKKYLAANDTENIEFKEYSSYRVSELKKIVHFDIDTLE